MNIDITDLPVDVRKAFESELRKSQVLSEFFEFLDLDQVMAILNRWGGVTMYVPKRISKNRGHDLVRAVGLKGAKALSWKYSGEFVHIPSGKFAGIIITKWSVFQDWKSGMGTKEIAVKYGRTWKTIRRYLREMRALPNRSHRVPVRRPVSQSGVLKKRFKAHLAILQDFDKGMKPAAIARKHGIRLKSVSALLNPYIPRD